MPIPVSLKKRLECLETHIDLEGKTAFKAFIFYPEAAVPFWQPENPEAWKRAHPAGRTLILQRKSCKISL